MDEHPVVHVAYSAAAAYAEWVDRQLPTEAKWKYDERSSLEQQMFAWGDESALRDG